MMLWTFGLALVVFLLASLMTGRLCSFFYNVYVLDRPTHRSLHVASIPRTGGVAILGSLAVGCSIAWICPAVSGRAEQPDFVATYWVVGLAVLIAAVSFCDDRVGLSPTFRLGIHALAAIAVVWGTGIAVASIQLPFVGILSVGSLSTPITILGLIWMANLYNFMDGMDGFAGGMTVLGFSVLSFIVWMGGTHAVGVLALLVAASAGGFLPYNFPPARIFMGDIGSVSLGFLAGALAVLGIHDGLFDVWVPFFIFSPFIVDATVTLLRRLLRGEKIWEAHREHYYQRLVLAGWGHRRTLLVEYGLMVASGLSAIVYHQGGEIWRISIFVGWIVTYVTLARSVPFVEHQWKAPQA